MHLHMLLLTIFSKTNTLTKSKMTKKEKSKKVMQKKFNEKN